jgi:hypothetical protein
MWTNVVERDITTDNLINQARKPWFNAQFIQSIPVTSMLSSLALDGDLLIYDEVLQQIMVTSYSGTGAMGLTGPTGATGATGAPGITMTGPSGYTFESYVITDTKAPGTVGGRATVGSWVARDVNTVTSTSGTRVSVNGSTTFTVGAGNWQCTSASPFFRVGAANTRLYNVTTNTELGLGAGSSSSGTAATAVVVTSALTCTFTLSQECTLCLQYQVTTTTDTSDLGRPNSFGLDEVYTEINLTYLGPVA